MTDWEDGDSSGFQSKTSTSFGVSYIASFGADNFPFASICELHGRLTSANVIYGKRCTPPKFATPTGTNHVWLKLEFIMNDVTNKCFEYRMRLKLMKKYDTSYF